MCVYIVPNKIQLLFVPEASVTLKCNSGSKSHFYLFFFFFTFDSGVQVLLLHSDFYGYFLYYPILNMNVITGLLPWKPLFPQKFCHVSESCSCAFLFLSSLRKKCFNYKKLLTKALLALSSSQAVRWKKYLLWTKFE